MAKPPASEPLDAPLSRVKSAWRELEDAVLRADRPAYLKAREEFAAAQLEVDALMERLFGHK